MSKDRYVDSIDLVLNRTLKLSPLEKSIVKAYMEGERDQDLASKMGIPKKTVRRKRQNIYAKIGYQILRYQQFKYQTELGHEAATPVTTRIPA